MAKLAFYLMLTSFIPLALVSACINTTSLDDTALLGTSPFKRSNNTSQRELFNPFVDDEWDLDIKSRHVIENPSLEQILRPGPLPEISLGQPSAPVIIVQYTSMGCPYCRQFHMETLPILKSEYINTGKVFYIFREFPIGYQSGAATIALRCVNPNQYFTLYDKLIRQQNSWVSRKVRHEPIFQIVKQVGISRDEFDNCFSDKILINQLNQIKKRGRTLGIIGTPNFFINERLYKRRLTIRDIRELVHKALANVE
ncbi:MAG: hypothetical protein TECD_01070 [Hyphomicrobiaceae bacterium hypho_1]